MSRYLVSDFVETALSPSLSISIHSIFSHSALLHTFIYLPLLTNFKRFLVSAQWYLCVLLNWLKLNKMSFDLLQFYCQFTISAVDQAVFLLWLTCMLYVWTFSEWQSNFDWCSWGLLLARYWTVDVCFKSQEKKLFTWCLFQFLR